MSNLWRSLGPSCINGHCSLSLFFWCINERFSYLLVFDPFHADELAKFIAEGEFWEGSQEGNCFWPPVSTEASRDVPDASGRPND